MPDGIREPFGLVDCESEVRVLKSEYSELYFDETPFNGAAIQPQAYLIIGRRGSGKTALAQSFAFQKNFDDPVYISVDRPEVYQQVLAEIATRVSESQHVAIARLRKVWEYALWCVILEQTGIMPDVYSQHQLAPGLIGRVSHLLNDIIDGVSRMLEVDGRQIDQRIHHLLSATEMKIGKAQALRLARTRPIILALDTLEQYDIHHRGLMNAMAALIEYASDFNKQFSDSGIHLKVFMSGEVFPYLEEGGVLNTLKSIQYPVYLLWRPKDLLRLISWRFHRYLEAHGTLTEHTKEKPNWTDPRRVLEQMWTPYFGTVIENHRGVKEHTFPYVLRHTQMRPRQLIVLCNSIAAHSRRAGRFPSFSEIDIREGVGIPRECSQRKSSIPIRKSSRMLPLS